LIASSLATLAALLAVPVAPPETLTVFAASDLQVAFGEIGPAFERASGIKVVLVYGSSGALAAQIERGAPADIIFSADEGYVRGLMRRGVLYPGVDRAYAVGHLVLATRRAGGLSLRTLADLTRPEVVRVAIANPDHAPYGRAAREALMAARVWRTLQPKLVLGENVRQTAQYLQTGAVEAAILSRSLALDTSLVTVPVNPRLHRPITQVAGIVKGTGRVSIARRFLNFVTGKQGWAIMQRYGFSRPTSP
jgi:molybdate transport system substrate-binding protein